VPVGDSSADHPGVLTLLVSSRKVVHCRLCDTHAWLVNSAPSRRSQSRTVCWPSQQSDTAAPVICVTAASTRKYPFASNHSSSKTVTMASGGAVRFTFRSLDAP
jgi:hypothetical protein